MRSTVIRPPGPSATTMLILPNSSPLPGKSSRKCPPRLPLCTNAEWATASDPVGKLSSWSPEGKPGLYGRLSEMAYVSPRFRRWPISARTCRRPWKPGEASPSSQDQGEEDCRKRADDGCTVTDQAQG